MNDELTYEELPQVRVEPMAKWAGRLMPGEKVVRFRAATYEAAKVAAIEEAARNARCVIARGEMDKSIESSCAAHEVIVAYNASVLFSGDESLLISPGRSNRRACHRGRQVKRGFRFTVEGLDGLYKLNPLRRVA